ncbi:ABC transporter substrate-binding protein [Brachybacterium saurashtrense]|uniref:Glycine/betaine ABC transporter n=1 Tax=Brachybacterium saurashtrense TaxID=556288 RepID=A0A345YR40_9MICO|nr:ABC transporter substrate-binding protein [Brachybacterium saurashtrense]AXK46392.1 glycine/betaine ABC transporter [Brachybacterium saurashtrense]RRR24133.1 glycine/betaine ABC transporter [Brachybacterium saurashtrense]
MSIHSTRRHLLGAVGAGSLALTAAACGSSDPFEEGDGSGSGGSDGGGAGGGTLAIGSQAYYSNEIIAELFAQVLEADGRTVDRQFQIGQREVYMPELESGGLDLLPEYLGNLLQHYDSEAASASPEEISSALSEALPDGLRVLSFAEASDQDSYTTTSEFASTHSLTTIGDLAGVDEDLTIAANSEFEVRPYGPDGAKEIYGVDVTVVPVEDSGGPLTVQALLDGDVQLADIYTADPTIAENDLVVLEDPESMILPQNVVPVVSERIDEAAASLIDGVIAQLSADDLVELNRQSVVDQSSSADIASAWLTEKGLV